VGRADDDTQGGCRVGSCGFRAVKRLHSGRADDKPGGLHNVPFSSGCTVGRLVIKNCRKAEQWRSYTVSIITKIASRSIFKNRLNFLTYVRNVGKFYILKKVKNLNVCCRTLV
jgi:hypothetical protein